jgi:hypothetical protein
MNSLYQNNLRLIRSRTRLSRLEGGRSMCAKISHKDTIRWRMLMPITCLFRKLFSIFFQQKRSRHLVILSLIDFDVRFLTMIVLSGVEIFSLINILDATLIKNDDHICLFLIVQMILSITNTKAWLLIMDHSNNIHIWCNRKFIQSNHIYTSNFI